MLKYKFQNIPTFSFFIISNDMHKKFRIIKHKLLLLHAGTFWAIAFIVTQNNVFDKNT